MKKIIAGILCICLLTTALYGCNSSSDAQPTESTLPTENITTTTISRTQLEYECGKKAYDELIIAADICENMASGIYEAWRFAIYDADDYSSYNMVSAFSSETGVSVTDLNKAAEALEVSSKVLYILLEDFSSAVTIILKAYEVNGTIERLDGALTHAKAELKTMTQEYSDYSQYPTLKSFYSEVDSYASFLKDPSGSFSQLQTTIENYRNQIRTYKSDLSFVFED